MFKVQSQNPNYLAKIVKLGPPRKHPNADKLQIFTVEFNNCITDLSYKENDLIVYFPLECAINKEFISFIDGFQKKELNQNKEARGFFDNNARVRAVKLRGEASAGFIIKFEILCQWLKLVDSVDWKVGQDFDTWRETLICQKYEILRRNSQNQNEAKRKIKRVSKILDGQFAIHQDT